MSQPHPFGIRTLNYPNECGWLIPVTRTPSLADRGLLQ
jgi:hypothetical protein